MSAEWKKSYRIDVTTEGRFAVIETAAGEADLVMSRHSTRDDARGWLVAHLQLINMDDMSNWTPNRGP